MTLDQTLDFCPYKGLTPYEEVDSEYFFGRDDEIEILIANLYSSRLTVLYGPSGIGKSSVLRAGVVSKLRKSRNLLVIVFREWQDDPVKRLRQAVESVLKDKLSDFQPAESASLDDFLADCVRQLDNAKEKSDDPRRPPGRLMIILDQFEDYFFHHLEENDTFSREFSRAVLRDDYRCGFLLSIREDAIARLDRFDNHLPNLYDNHIRIGGLSRDDARDAILKPSKVYQNRPDGYEIEIEKYLVERILDELEGRPTDVATDIGVKKREFLRYDQSTSGLEAPYLQLVLTKRLWKEEAHTGKLHLETYDRLGGKDSIVRTHLDRTLGEFKPEERKTAAFVFRFLVTPSGAKIALNAQDLSDPAYTGLSTEFITAVLKRLSDADIRILRPIDSRGDPENIRYEIFHDLLAEPILDWRERYYREPLLESHFKRNVEVLDLSQQIVVARALRVLYTPAGTRLSRTLDEIVKLTDLPEDQVIETIDLLDSLEIVRRELRAGREWIELTTDNLVTGIEEWAKAHSDIRLLSRRGVMLLGSILILLVLLLTCGFALLWVRNLDNATLSIAALSMIAGGLGGTIYALQSYIKITGNRRIEQRYSAWYLMQPFIGALLALSIHLIIEATLLTGDIRMTMVALSFLVGLYSNQVTTKLYDKFENLLPQKRKEDKFEKT